MRTLRHVAAALLLAALIVSCQDKVKVRVKLATADAGTTTTTSTRAP